MSASLILDDHSKYEGISFGAEESISGEVVFNTGMTGYVESLSDPSYRGQILVFTYPLIGNYGVPANNNSNDNNNSDTKADSMIARMESDKIQVCGIIISDYSKDYSHHEAVKSLGDWLKEEGIPGLYGIDTRSLTIKLREKGVMLGKIVIDKDTKIIDPNKRNLVEEVSQSKHKIYGSGKGNIKILLIDTGVKLNIIRSLLNRNVEIIRVPWNFDIFNSQYKYDAIFLTNGPGDPKMCKDTIKNVKAAISKKIPIFGICLGNQILALAAGANTYKLKYGHRSQNQPCIKVGTNKCFITSQNHGYAVDEKSLPNDWMPWFRNANDGTNEGIRHKSGLFASVQWHPEANPGPTDTNFLFDEFIETIRNFKKH